MLQQTTVAAVVPYYERFLERFPALADLAGAQLEDVLELWSGLGYYSRARNLFKAAVQLHALPEFPKTYTELQKISGFGPYTSRAVSSIAFNEPVGVLDGNVIRVLSRFYGLDDDWWKPAVREHYQVLADQWVSKVSAREMNQALMELGATVCTPRNPACLTCPLFSACAARREGRVEELPRPKPRRKMEFWIWTIAPRKVDDSLLLVKNDYAPFLKGQWIWPGTVTRKTKAPAEFDYFHTVTHHKIYVQVCPIKAMRSKIPEVSANSHMMLVHPSELRRRIPTALILKAVPFMKKRNGSE
jgi:A/G-specific adenine glycosylase